MEDKSMQWIEVICVVNFDNELGSIVTTIYPENTLVNLSAIATLSFPESNTAQPVHTFFFSLPLNQTTAFGFSHYIMQKDTNNPRGYTQRALVIVTKFYFSVFYCELTSTLASHYFAQEDPQLLKVGLENE